MANKVHSHIFNIEGQEVEIKFKDKRTFNSFVNALSKAEEIKFKNPISNNEEPKEKNENETLKETFEGWEIHEKYGHIALKPPEEHKREEVILTPSMSILWQPEIKGHYWNDGMYHFFPKKTKQSCEVSEYDLCKNFKMLGAN